MEKLIDEYFNAWNLRDIDALKKIFSDNILLEDWEIKEIGLSAVIEANKKIFNEVPNIKAHVQRIAMGHNCVFCELKISINAEEIIDVVDIITIKDDKITEIKAYKK